MGNFPPQRPAANPIADSSGTAAALQLQLAAVQAALSAVRAAQLAAESGREQAREAREQEREAREAAEAGRRQAEKDGFFFRMRGMCSSSAADSASSADEAQRGALRAVEVPLTAFIDGAGGLPGDTAKRAAAAAWAAFRAAHSNEWIPPCSKTVGENRHVHPTIERLLRPLVPDYLRLWCNAITVDDEARAEIKPDFTFSHMRDAMPSLIGGVLFVEVKLPGDFERAKLQAIIYARRRIFKLYCECLARSEPLHMLQAFALATDGSQMAIVRVRSGAPPPGGSFAAATPCPAEFSAGLQLLGAWDFKVPPVLPTAPPAAIHALLQFLAQRQVLLGPGVPMTSVRVELTREGKQGSPELLMPPLLLRLGLGGTSDAYLCDDGGEKYWWWQRRRWQRRQRWRRQRRLGAQDGAPHF